MNRKRGRMINPIFPYFTKIKENRASSQPLRLKAFHALTYICSHSLLVLVPTVWQYFATPLAKYCHTVGKVLSHRWQSIYKGASGFYPPLHLLLFQIPPTTHPQTPCSSVLAGGRGGWAFFSFPQTDSKQINAWRIRLLASE